MNKRVYVVWGSLAVVVAVVGAMALPRLHFLRIQNDTSRSTTIRVTVLKEPRFAPVSLMLAPGESSTVCYFRRGERTERTFLMDVATAGQAPIAGDCGYLDLGPTFGAEDLTEEGSHLSLRCD